MNILELAGFYSNYGGNFIPTLENLDQKLTALGHNTFYIFSNRNLSNGFYTWEVPFSQKHNTKLVDYQSFSFVEETSEPLLQAEMAVNTSAKEAKKAHCFFMKDVFIVFPRML